MRRSSISARAIRESVVAAQVAINGWVDGYNRQRWASDPVDHSRELDADASHLVDSWQRALRVDRNWWPGQSNRPALVSTGRQFLVRGLVVLR